MHSLFQWPIIQCPLWCRVLTAQQCLKGSLTHSTTKTVFGRRLESICINKFERFHHFWPRICPSTEHDQDLLPPYCSHLKYQSFGSDDSYPHLMACYGNLEVMIRPHCPLSIIPSQVQTGASDGDPAWSTDQHAVLFHPIKHFNSWRKPNRPLQ